MNSMSATLADSFGRRFTYLRLSVTDLCNFRCVYCLPHGYQKNGGDSFLSLSEIRNLVEAFAELGVWKFRLTGGEPTLRPDLLDILDQLKDLPGVKTLAMSTNGYRLKELAPWLFAKGLRKLNVSLDTLDKNSFFKLTGQDRLTEILDGVEAALHAGFSWIKINAVLMKGVNDENQQAFFDWIRDRPLSVRFIELMPTGQNQELFRKVHVRGLVLREQLVAQGWSPKKREEADGPAEEFTHPDYLGRIGIIAPYANEFCSTCNRLRVTSRGALRLCLFGESNTSLRHLLQHENQKEELKDWVLSNLMRKEISHYLPEGRYGNNQTFSAMGG